MTKRSAQTRKQNNAKSLSGTNDGDRKSDGANVDAAIVPQIPPPPRNCQNDQQSSGNSLAGWKRVLEYAALIAGIAYAIVTYFMWRDSRHNFATDQRAWVMLESLSGDMEVGKQYIVWVSFKNFGKTPAIHASLTARMQMLAPNQSPDFKELRYVNAIANVAPNQPFRAPIKPDSGGPVESGNISILDSVQAIETIFGRVDYSDIFGTHHWSEFCYYLERDGHTYSLCPGDFNKSDDNH
jgi:hypothetical protein